MDRDSGRPYKIRFRTLSSNLDVDDPVDLPVGFIGEVDGGRKDAAYVALVAVEGSEENDEKREDNFTEVYSQHVKGPRIQVYLLSYWIQGEWGKPKEVGSLTKHFRKHVFGVQSIKGSNKVLDIG